MKREELFMKLFNFSRPTYYKWKREHTPALSLLEKYFTQEELEEFLETGEIGFLEERKINENGGVLSKIYYEIEQMKNRISELEAKNEN